MLGMLQCMHCSIAALRDFYLLFLCVGESHNRGNVACPANRLADDAGLCGKCFMPKSQLLSILPLRSLRGCCPTERSALARYY